MLSACNTYSVTSAFASLDDVAEDEAFAFDPVRTGELMVKVVSESRTRASLQSARRPIATTSSASRRRELLLASGVSGKVWVPDDDSEVDEDEEEDDDDEDEFEEEFDRR